MHGNLIKENLIIDKDTVSMVGLDHVAFGDREKDIAMYASHPRIKSLIEGYDRYKTTSSEVTLKKSLIIFYYKYKLLQDIEDHIDSIVYENNKNIKKRSLKELKQNILPMVHKRNNVIKHIQEIL